MNGELISKVGPNGKALSLYTMKYRPPGYATCPEGFTLVESGTGGHFPRRFDLPAGKHAFGVIGYERTLTPRELETYEMLPAIAST